MAPSILAVDFGRVDAESEENLGDYFVDTGVLDKLAHGRKQFVIGRKGSGKTALFRLANDSRLGRPVISLDFADYPWDAHKLVREAGLSAESSFVASWRFTFLAAVCRQWADLAPSNIRKQAAAMLRRIYQDEEPGLLEVLFDRFKRLRKIDLPKIEGLGGLGGLELDEKGDGPILAKSLSQWCRVLGEMVEKNFDEAPFTIKLDRLDEGWDASDDSKLLLAGILKAARDFNLRLARRGQPPAVLTFLRSDIFNELRFNDKNKMTADVESLEWSDSKLVDVADARIARSLKIKRSKGWDAVFSNEPMRQGAKISSYILKRTMGRPRDMIAFCLAIQTAAREHDHNIADKNDVYAAETEYSSHIYNELDDEMHKQLPQSRGYLQALRTLGKTRFTLAEWLSTLRQREAGLKEAEARTRLKLLFDYSVVGVPRRGGIARGTTFQFNYHDRLVEPDFAGEMIVHPALKKQLQLKEPRRDASQDDDE
jgi:hypothetical protein